MIFLELKHVPSLFFWLGLFCTIYKLLMAERCFYVLFYHNCCSKFCIQMKGANPFILYYDVRAVALPKFVFLCYISSDIFGNVLSLTISFLHIMFAIDLTCCLSWNFSFLKIETPVWNGFIAEEWTRKHFTEWKKSNSSWNFLNSTLFK